MKRSKDQPYRRHIEVSKVFPLGTPAFRLRYDKTDYNIVIVEHSTSQVNGGYQRHMTKLFVV